MSNLFLTTAIKVPLGQDVCAQKSRIARHLGVRVQDLLSVTLHRQSTDARDKRDVKFVCSYLVETANVDLKNATPYLPPVDLLDKPAKPISGGSCIVVGAGPSGLFLARLLTKNGVKVTIVERGSDLSIRQQKVSTFFDGGEFDEDCNVQFGLGGAGTFSDGKLTTGTSSPLTNTVFCEFVRQGAPKSILTDALPHIGTDNLVKVVANMRDALIEGGCKFLFDTTVVDLIVQDGIAVGVVTRHGDQTSQLTADCVALCCGHSAKSMFHALVKHGVNLKQKPFAVGLRIEHCRQFINEAQFGKLFATHRDLGVATYKLTNNVDGRGCYSFCMCPGGVVVPANSEKDSVVVNGMSNFDRNAANSNSAIVVAVSPDDVARYGFGGGVLAGLDFQESLEKAAYDFGGGNYVAPSQNVVDFVRRRASKQLQLSPSYPRGVNLCNFWDILPEDICEILRQSLLVFDKKLAGFAQNGVLTGVETRTSSPVQVVRDATTLQSNIKALFPVGEGAGHAGGIVTSAVDGLRAAQAILQLLKSNVSCPD